MASKKNLKKDINFLTEEIINACLVNYHLKKQTPESAVKIDSIMQDAVNLRNELINRINNPVEVPEGSSIKAVYTEMLGQMMSKADEAFDRLAEA